MDGGWSTTGTCLQPSAGQNRRMLAAPIDRDNAPHAGHSPVGRVNVGVIAIDG